MADAAVLIVVFDGLRRDHITAERMPNLTAFMGCGSDVPRSRSVFPSMTRVNASALATGAPGAINGLVANKFYDPAIFPDRVIDTSSRQDVEEAIERTGRPFLTATSLGDVLGASGRTMAVWSAASPGTTYLTHPNAARFGHRRLCLNDLKADTPEARELTARHGELPPPERPNAKRSRYLESIVVDVLERRAEPDVGLVWFNDPDMTYHYKGIGSDEAREAQKAIDQSFGAILEAVNSRPDRDKFQIIALSDHGQIVAREKIDVKAEFAAGGIRLGKAFGPDVEVVGNLSSVGTLRARDTTALCKLASFLVERPWVGAVFTTGSGGAEGVVPGSFNKDLLMTGHSRAPDLYYVMASDSETTHGALGGGPYRSDVPEGGGMHGGLHLREINNLVALSGSRFKSGYASPLPGGIIDIAPTVLSLLGLQRPPTMIGRVLEETLADGGSLAEAHELVAETAANGRASRFVRHRVGRASYIHGLDVS